jgi:hypothetical protein
MPPALGRPPEYVERARARVLAQGYPWLTKMEKLHHGRMLGPQQPWRPAASKAPKWTVAEAGGDKPRRRSTVSR